MNLYVHMKTACPACAQPLNSSVGMHGTEPPPRPGDLSICTACAAGLVYTPDPQAPDTLTLRALTPDLAKSLGLAQADLDTLARMQQTVRRGITWL